MSRRCTVCAHASRAEIDTALVAGDASYRDVSGRFGLSVSALHRHAGEHLPARMVKASEAAEVVQADSLLDRLRQLNRETAEVLKAAKEAGQHELTLKAIQRAERQLELEARLLGELREGQTVNVLLSPEWLSVRTALMIVLRQHPEAAVAVAASLKALGDGT